ncbi:protein kinase [Nocardia sp. NPDC059240]|uniref:protein kinase domain-containing protein n=1 Tax=Nocardia sp. NPDC059240 TaxID=3346786 RepID=UPI0036A796CD
MLSPGEEIAGYKVVRRLGFGGMATVYLAEHPRLSKSVALKVLKDEYTSDRTVRAAFNREAGLAAGLDHPNIVQVHDRNGPNDTRLWLAMRYVAGGDLSALLQTAPGGLPVERVVRLITDAAHALDYAHAQGVLHRDVKPANLMIDHDPRYGERAVLTDFGIARARDATVTAVGYTLAYVAPERFGDKLSDHRADIYSLGCTLFHLLTGEFPFRRGSNAAVIAAHLSDPPPSVTAGRPDFPSHLDHVIATALAKNPADRYSSCAELVTDLLRATTATIFNPAAKPSEPQQQPSRSAGDPERVTKAGPAPSDTDEATREWLRRVAESDPSSMGEVGMALVSRGMFDEAEFWYRQFTEAGYTNAMYRLGSLLKRRKKLDEAESWYRRAAEAGSAPAMHDLGDLLQRRGALEEAKAWYRKAADAGSSPAIGDLGALLKRQGAADEAEAWYRRFAESGDIATGHRLGQLLESQRKLEEAETWYRRGAEVRFRPSMVTLADLLTKRGAHQEAERWYRKAADDGDQSAMVILAALLAKQGAHQEAETWYRRAAEAGDQPSMRALADLLEKRGKLDEASIWRERGAVRHFRLFPGRRDD